MKLFTSGFLTFILLFSLLLVGRYNSAANQPLEMIQNNKPILIFEKKPCFGFCPVYKAEFLKNGEVNVTYQRPLRSPVPETTSFKLSQSEVCDLWMRGEKLGFFKMKNRYETLMTDFQVRELTLFNKRNQPKHVYYTEGASPEFEQYLRDLAQLVERNINVSFEAPKE